MFNFHISKFLNLERNMSYLIRLWRTKTIDHRPRDDYSRQRGPRYRWQRRPLGHLFAVGGLSFWRLWYRSWRLYCCCFCCVRFLLCDTTTPRTKTKNEKKTRVLFFLSLSLSGNYLFILFSQSIFKTRLFESTESGFFFLFIFLFINLLNT